MNKYDAKLGGWSKLSESGLLGWKVIQDSFVGIKIILNDYNMPGNNWCKN